LTRSWTKTNDRQPHDRPDALLWLAAVLLLGLLPVGRVSGDGLGYAREFAAGTWRLNPNHLLFEPAGAAWHQLLALLGSKRPIVDQLKLLSVLAGAVGAALFRWGVARRLADRRWIANWGTAWLVLGSTYLRLLVDDEFHMIQMPFLVGFAIALLRYLERPGLRRAAVAGALAGGAALCFISNGLLGVLAAVVLGVRHVWRPGRRERGETLRLAAGLLAGFLLVAVTGLGTAWGLTHPGRPFASWLTSYSGGSTPARTGLVYGLRFTPEGVASGVVHAAYGAASAAVDLAPAVAAARDEGAPGRSALIALAWVLAAVALGGGLWNALRAWRQRAEPRAGTVLLLQAIWWPAILAFGIYWNNSDDQFYFQLAVPFGALAIQAATEWPGRRRWMVLLVACGAAALAWNAVDVGVRSFAYPRAAWTSALLRETRGACLIVTPGWDDASNLLALAAPVEPRDEPARLSLTDLAVAMPAAPGLARLSAAVERCLASGRRVDLIDLYDAPPYRFPWKFLRQLGYEPEALRRTLAPFGADPEDRRAGPFRLRSIRPRIMPL
jgi:hypothetical protein